MRISEMYGALGLLALAVSLSPAGSFDGMAAPEGNGAVVTRPGTVGISTGIDAVGAPTPVAPVAVPAGPIIRATPLEAFRSGTQALREGRVQQAVLDLQYAADRNVPGALWRLARIYADGEGVPVDKARAYEYFRRLTLLYGHDSAGTFFAPFVAKAFVNLGEYYQEGIPGMLASDPARARDMFRYAASYFGDAEAQYFLGRQYLHGNGIQKDPLQAARWLGLAAEKGDPRAQALLGQMLFQGEDIAKQAARGLFWLILAKDGAGPSEMWITDMYTSALAQADEKDRTLAHKYLEDWLRKPR
jgi:TPR repeat protein